VIGFEFVDLSLRMCCPWHWYLYSVYEWIDLDL